MPSALVSHLAELLGSHLYNVCVPSFLSSRPWLAVETGCARTSVTWSRAAWPTSMVCMILRECGSLDLSGELCVCAFPHSTEYLTGSLLCGWLFLESSFNCEWQCCGGEISLVRTVCGSHKSLCACALVFRELKKVGHIHAKPPFILPVAEEFFLGEWYSICGVQWF